MEEYTIRITLELLEMMVQEKKYIEAELEASDVIVKIKLTKEVHTFFNEQEILKDLPF